jgi:hypothetical protein
VRAKLHQIVSGIELRLVLVAGDVRRVEVFGTGERELVGLAV